MSLPRRAPGGYRITGLLWKLTSSALVVRTIKAETPLPAVPQKPLTEIQLTEFLRDLARCTEAATTLLRRIEPKDVRREYRTAQPLRVELLVMSGHTVIGRVDGTQAVYGPRGNTITLGERTPPNLGKRQDPSPN